jgi:hypothetical protein
MSALPRFSEEHAMYSNKLAIQNRIDQYRSLVRNTIDQSAKENLSIKLAAEEALLIRVARREQENIRKG